MKPTYFLILCALAAASNCLGAETRTYVKVRIKNKTGGNVRLCYCYPHQDDRDNKKLRPDQMRIESSSLELAMDREKELVITTNTAILIPRCRYYALTGDEEAWIPPSDQIEIPIDLDAQGTQEIVLEYSSIKSAAKS